MTNIIPTEMRYPNDTARSLAWAQVKEVFDGWRRLGHLLCPVDVHLSWGSPKFSWHRQQTRIDVEVLIPHHWHEHVVREGLLELGGRLCLEAGRLLPRWHIELALPEAPDGKGQEIWEAQVAFPWESGVKHGWVVRYAGIARWASSPKAAQQACIQAYHEALTGEKA